jgi:hypothetical protein
VELDEKYIVPGTSSGYVSDTAAPDQATNRIPTSLLESHYGNLVTAGLIPNPSGTGNTAPSMDSRVQNDQKMYENVQEEYCFYEQRYRYALRRFLELATSRIPTDNAEAKVLLESTVVLNRRLNFMIEFMNYLAIRRVSSTNTNVTSINNDNKIINAQLTTLKLTYDKLMKMDTIGETQKEMIRYTKEKNNYVTNQISVWTALNVLAIATVFYVYRSS